MLVLELELTLMLILEPLGFLTKLIKFMVYLELMGLICHSTSEDVIAINGAITIINGIDHPDGIFHLYQIGRAHV